MKDPVAAAGGALGRVAAPIRAATVNVMIVRRIVAMVPGPPAQAGSSLHRQDR